MGTKMEDFDADALHGADLLGQALGRTPGASDLDEFVAFQVFIDGARHAASIGEADAFLRACLCDVFEVLACHLDEYLWHRDRFTLELSLGEQDEEPHLAGHMRTGDGAEDEWFVIYLLKMLTSRRNTMACRVWDMDGELLLIEAALVTPQWLSPENSENRCWLRDGKVHLLRGSTDGRSRPLVQAKALDLLRKADSPTLARDKVQDVIDARLQGYPLKPVELSKHLARVVVPATVARLLVTFPQLVGVAADHLPPPPTSELRGLHKDLTAEEAEVSFDSSGQQDMICTSIRLTKCQYARLVALGCQLPHRYTQRHWREPKSGLPTGSAGEKAMRLGAMLSCGLEVAYLLRTSSATSALRWPAASCPQALLAEVPWWQDSNFSKFASAMGLVRGSKGSKQAFQQQHKLDGEFRSALLQGWRATGSQDLQTQESDDEEWLHVSVEELDEELRKRQAEFDAFDRKQAASKGKDAKHTAEPAGKEDVDAAQIKQDLAAMGGKLSSLLESTSNMDGIEAAASPFPTGTHKATPDTDSDEDDCAGDPLDVLGMEESASDSDEDDARFGVADGRGGEWDQYMSALDDELDEALDAQLQDRPNGDSVTERGISLGSHHVKVHEHVPLSLDVHAMEHIFASICAEAQLQPGPASLLLGEFALGKGDATYEGGIAPSSALREWSALDGMD
mmetsp:Transcript_30358/g.69863  ORF Transcript_30358/g.69863 Transcript_30358/m.69863 type:complete len:681 (-) Transcript_30358:21-2063(-)